MSVGFLRPLQSRLLKQKTLDTFCEHRQWLNSMMQDFETSGAPKTKPSVFMYGSAISGTAFDTGDADYAVLFAQAPTADGAEWQHHPIERESQEEVLSHLYDHLREKCKQDDTALKSQRIFRARIPIVKCLTTRNSAADVCQFDISLSADGVRNSMLLRRYMEADPRLRAGALCVKEWGKKEKILNARHGWISPYALTIMYIFYAQQSGITTMKCDEGAVSVLSLFNTESSPSLPSPAEQWAGAPRATVDHILPWHDVDEATVLSDVRGFFRFFGSESFDFDSGVIDIRVNNPVRTKDAWQEELGQTDERELWHLLGHQVFLLRDPFESHNLGRSVDFFKAESIRERLRVAAEVENPLFFLEHTS